MNSFKIYKRLTWENRAAPPGTKTRKEQGPPPPATLLQFPSYYASETRNISLDECQNLIQVFNNLGKKGANRQHVDALNVSLVQKELDELFPDAHLPPLSWSTKPTTTEDGNVISLTSGHSSHLSNNTTIPNRRVFYEIAKELLYDKEDAFRTIRREKPPPGRSSARLVHFRKFWDSLMTMADFWDTSADHYFSISDDESGVSTEKNERCAMEIDDLRSEAQDFNCGPSAASNAYENETKKQKYTGYRISTGSEMNGRYRDDTVTAFVGAIVQAFHCRLEFPQTQQQKLNVQGMLIDLPVAGSVYRIPKDKSEARKGIKEGPLFCVWPRDEIVFRAPGQDIGQGEREVLDVLREIGLMTMLAQKRSREGKKEERPGLEKWWAKAPRWGGGLCRDEDLTGGDIAEVAGQNGSEVARTVPGGDSIKAEFPGRIQGLNELAGDKPIEASSELPQRPRKKAKKTDAWREVRPPSSTWEKNIKYSCVGRNWESGNDDVSLTVSVIQGYHTNRSFRYI